jgi:S1-C subfamily serine protease
VRGEPLDLGYLGVSGSPETDSAGVLVTEVVPGSPAEEAGIGVGDVIVGLDGDPVREISELSAAIKLYLPGEMVELEIERDDTTIVVPVELGRLTPN